MMGEHADDKTSDHTGAFDFVFRSRSSVNPIPVNIPDIHVTLTEALIPALEDALEKATCPIKGILLTNPQNPLGQCYPRSILEGCLKLCQRHKIHFISDEIYALTSYTCPDLPSPAPFISALSLDLASLGCDLSRLHTVWSTSKDFGQSGVRMVSVPNLPRVLCNSLSPWTGMCSNARKQRTGGWHCLGDEHPDIVPVGDLRRRSSHIPEATGHHRSELGAAWPQL